MALALLVAALVSLLQRVDPSGSTAGSTAGRDAPAGLITRSGAPARPDGALVARLRGLSSYMASGRPAEEVRAFVLDEVMARALGKAGRAEVAHVLDYTHEMVTRARPRRHSRDRLFATLAALNARLDRQGFGYYVFGGLHWDRAGRSLERVSLDVYAIVGARRYRAGGRVIPVLHVTGGGHSGDGGPIDHRLGFTSAGHSEAMILPARVERELAEGLWPALDSSAFTPLFDVAGPAARSSWYRFLRRALAEVLARDFAAISGGRNLDRGAIQAALIGAVELHEIQHLLDFTHDRRHRRGHDPRPRPLSGPFERLAERSGDPALARAGLYETSAHLAQMARDRATVRVTLSVVTSYAFTDRCDHADCFAALIVLDELASELGLGAAPVLTTDEAYELSAVATVYARLAVTSPEELAGAAGAAWERLFEARLDPVSPAP